MAKNQQYTVIYKKEDGLPVFLKLCYTIFLLNSTLQPGWRTRLLTAALILCNYRMAAGNKQFSLKANENPSQSQLCCSLHRNLVDRNPPIWF
jgi:hypothetical protein